MQASAKIAKFLSSHLNVPLVDCAEKANDYDTLFIVNGPMAFCGFLDELAEMVNDCERIIWVQNDIIIKPPTTDPTKTRAESPFRVAFANYGKPLDYWTTIPSNVKTDGSAYVNWNLLTYEFIEEFPDWRREGLFYYGAYRTDREKYFKKYFSDPDLPVTISATPIPGRKFQSISEHIRVIPASQNIIKTCREYQASLYIEDNKSHSIYCSPANRFYEMLSSGIPILFDKNSVKTMEIAGYDVSPFVVSSSQSILERFNALTEIQLDQLEWHRDYKKELIQQLERALEGIWK
jgi:hypothetical protein